MYAEWIWCGAASQKLGQDLSVCRVELQWDGGFARVFGEAKEICVEERKDSRTSPEMYILYEGECRQRLSCSRHTTAAIVTRPSFSFIELPTF